MWFFLAFGIVQYANPYVTGNGICHDLGRVVNRACGNVHALAGLVASVTSREYFREVLMKVGACSCALLCQLSLVGQRSRRGQRALLVYATSQRHLPCSFAAIAPEANDNAMGIYPRAALARPMSQTPESLESSHFFNFMPTASAPAKAPYPVRFRFRCQLSVPPVSR